MDGNDSAALEDAVTEGERVGLPDEAGSPPLSRGRGGRRRTSWLDARSSWKLTKPCREWPPQLGRRVFFGPCVRQAGAVGSPPAFFQVEAAQSLVKAMSGLHGLEALQKALEKAKELKVNSKAGPRRERLFMVLGSEKGGRGCFRLSTSIPSTAWRECRFSSLDTVWEA